MQKRSKLKVLTSAERAAESRKYVLPNPGDLIIMLVFGWAMLCFFLVTLGERLLMKLARVSSSTTVQDFILESEQALGAVMIGGSLILGLTVVFSTKYPRVFLIVIIYALNFSNASWKPLHDVNTLIKYFGIIFLGAFAAQAFYKNFWRVVSVPFPRIMMAYFLWVAAVCVLVGGRTDDLWFAGNELTFMLGFALFWMYQFNNRYGLDEFNRVLALSAVIVTVTHLLSVVLWPDYLNAGRFQSYWARATIFSVSYSPLVVVMFWRAMADKDPQKATFFAGTALVGFALILWSGSRGPSAATLLGVIVLWWLFRSRLLLVMLFIAVLGLAGQLILSVGSSGDLEKIASRFESNEDNRTEIWERYIEVAARSPVYGFSPSKMQYAIVGGGVGDYLSDQGIKINTQAVHNSYLGIVLRLGVGGLVLFLILMGAAMAQAYRVLLSKRIPQAEKEVYILPAALIPNIAFMIMFEDTIPGSGKGTFNGFILYASIFICQIYGARLLNEYERSDSGRKAIQTIDDLKLLPLRSDSA